MKPSPTWRTPIWKFVEIHWHDAAEADDAWVREEELPGPAHVVTRGWLLKEEDDHLVIGASIISDRDEKWTFGDVCVIPKGMIKKRRTIKC